VYRALKCRSPERVVGPLEGAVSAQGKSLADLRVIDLGAGNGIVGELLRRAGARALVGIDILPEAAKAALRDRPGAYDDYVVTDLTEPDPAADRRLRAFAPNCLVTVAALGFGDIPPEALVKAFNLLPDGGWLAMCIKDRFLEEDDDSGFGRLVRSMVADGTIEVLHRESYVHRLSIAGEELYYVAVVARKQRPARTPA
jgi:trans-aconitate methyltransferase